MDLPIDISYIREFLRKNNLGVISTVNKHNRPNAAPIYFIPHAKFEVYFITPENSQKIINISTNNAVVITIISSDLTETVQIQGTAFITHDSAANTLGELARTLNYGEDFLTSLPVLKYEDQKKVVVKVTPQIIRIRRYTQHSYIDRSFDSF